MRWRRLLLCGWVVAATHAQPHPAKFTLEIPDAYPGEFELGGTLRISRQPVRRVIFRLHNANVEIHNIEIQGKYFYGENIQKPNIH